MIDDVLLAEDGDLIERDPADIVIEQDIIEESEADDDLLSGDADDDDDLLDQVGDCDGCDDDHDD